MSQRFYVETLGCPKNQVDSDKLIGTLLADGMELVLDILPAGAHVVLVDGRLAGFADKRRLLTFGGPDHDDVAEALAVIGRRHRRHTVETVNGLPVSTSGLADALRRQGFTPVPRGLRFHAGR